MAFDQFGAGPAHFSQFTGTDTYIASDELRHSVNVAVALARPLLVRGEPGTGKTLLAENVAEALGLPLLRWHVKSTTKAKDGLYVYDTVARLHDSRFGDGDVKDIAHYIKLGPLGQALAATERVVLLIDEVDKADLEFPNDLLHELDAMSFHIAETNDTITAKQRPFVIITSNNEKELPDAFLRRCVFHFIEFPGVELMKDIIRVHHPSLEETLVTQAIRAFYELREIVQLRKRPSTSELIDWLAVLHRAGIDAGRLTREVPMLGTLLKKETDVQTVNELLRRTKGRAA